MKLETARCIIQNFAADDAAQLYKILSDTDVMEFIEPPLSLEDTHKFIKQAGLCDPPLIYALIWKENSEVIGHIIFHQYEENSYEIGWILNKSYWHKAVASEVTAALIKYSRSLGIESCIIECDRAQAASKHIALKYGFIYEGEDNGCEIYRLRL